MKKEALDVLKTRRSIRAFADRQITTEELDTVLEAGAYAPSAMGAQQAVTVAVQDPVTVAKLDAMNAKVLGMDGMEHPYYGAPAILLVFAPADGYAPVEDGALVAGNLMNAAHAAGLGTCYIARCKAMFELPEGKELMREWGLGENMVGVSSIAVGYPAGDYPQAKLRKPEAIIKV